MAVMVWSGSATHPSNWNAPLELEISLIAPAKSSWKKHKNASPQTQTTGRLTRSKAFARSKTKRLSLLDLFSCLVFQSFNFQQDSPHRSFSSFTASINGTPFDTNWAFPCCHLRRPQNFPPTNRRRHERFIAKPLALRFPTNSAQINILHSVNRTTAVKKRQWTNFGRLSSEPRLAL